MLYDIFKNCGSRVSTDSRNVEPGSLFFALRGDRFDGNRYAADALAAGAARAVVEDPRVAVDNRYIVVDDALFELQQLSAQHRRALGATVLAITGTNGKTTTKELIAAVLGKRYKVAATAGNLNNHIGVPLTLLSMREGDFGVVEMGASAQWEIAALCELAGPDYGLITNIGRAHLEGFGGAEGVRRAKGELYDFLSTHGGTAFVRAADNVLMKMAREHKGLKVREYFSDGEWPSQLEGDYNIANIAAAVAVGREFGVPDDDIRDAIASYTPANNRSQHVETGRNTLVMDCYNANPSSMRAALESFAGSTVILGDMAELGKYAAPEHESIVALLAERGIGEAYLVGKHFVDAVRRLPAVPGLKIETFADTDALVALLRDNPLHGRTILIKGSRSMGLERVREEL
jgi:UDP-N-acetylmuramoyl-tripeptide--D-alanyl-D-alanine ligase